MDFTTMVVTMIGRFRQGASIQLEQWHVDVGMSTNGCAYLRVEVILGQELPFQLPVQLTFRDSLRLAWLSQLLVSVARLGLITGKTDDNMALWLQSFFQGVSRWLPCDSKPECPGASSSGTQSSLSLSGAKRKLGEPGGGLSMQHKNEGGGSDTPRGGSPGFSAHHWTQWRCAISLLARLRFERWDDIAAALDLQSLANLPLCCQVELIHAMIHLLHSWCRDWKAARGRSSQQESLTTWKDEEEMLDCIRRFSRSFDQLAQFLALCAGHDEPVLLGAILLFYSDTTAVLFSKYSIPMVILLPPRLAQRCILCTDPHIVSTVCGLFALYREQMLLLRRSTAGSVANSNVLKDIIPRLNAIVLDACNTVWRNKAFEDAPQSNGDVAPGDDVDGHALLFTSAFVDRLRATVATVANGINAGSGMDVKKLISLTHGVAWQGFAQRFWQGKLVKGTLLEEELKAGGLQILHHIEQRHKTEYLDFLCEQGFAGMHAFLHAFISSLAKRVRSK